VSPPAARRLGPLPAKLDLAGRQLAVTPDPALYLNPSPHHQIGKRMRPATKSVALSVKMTSGRLPTRKDFMAVLIEVRIGSVRAERRPQLLAGRVATRNVQIADSQHLRIEDRLAFALTVIVGGAKRRMAAE